MHFNNVIVLIISTAFFIFGCAQNVSLDEYEESSESKQARVRSSAEYSSEVVSEVSSAAESSEEPAIEPASSESETPSSIIEISSAGDVVPFESSVVSSESVSSSEEPLVVSSSSAVVGAIDAFSTIEAESFDFLYENSANGSTYSPRISGSNPLYVNYFTDGDYMRFDAVDFGEGAQSVILKYAQAFDGASVDFVIDGLTGTNILTYDVINFGTWGDFKSDTAALNQIVTGVHDLYIFAHHSGGAGDYDNFTFLQDGVTEPVSSSSGVSSSDQTAIHCPDTEWKFVAVADSRGSDQGINSGVLNDIRDRILEESGIDFVIYPGDMTNNGNVNEENYFKQVFSDQIKAAGIDFYGVAGNHEYYQGDFSRFTGYNPNNGPDGDGRTFSLTHNNAQIIGIGWWMYDLALESWLKPQVTSAAKMHVFSMSHATLWNVYHTEAEATFWSAERDEYINWIAERGGRMHFTGHDHFYDHSKVTTSGGKEFHQLVVGTAGAPYYDFTSYSYGKQDAQNVVHKKTHGYSVIAVNGNKVTLQFKELSGSTTNIIDTIEYFVPCN